MGTGAAASCAMGMAKAGDANVKTWTMIDSMIVAMLRTMCVRLEKYNDRIFRREIGLDILWSHCSLMNLPQNHVLFQAILDSMPYELTTAAVSEECQAQYGIVAFQHPSSSNMTDELKSWIKCTSCTTSRGVF